MSPAPKYRFDGDRLIKAREAAGMTQAELAVALGLPKSQQGNISRWENDVVPSASNLMGLAVVLRAKKELKTWGISMEWFMVLVEPVDEEAGASAAEGP